MRHVFTRSRCRLDCSRDRRSGSGSPGSESRTLGNAIADLASRIHFATYELLVLIREFDASAGWNNGFLSCAHWLNWRTGMVVICSRLTLEVGAVVMRAIEAVQTGCFVMPNARRRRPQSPRRCHRRSAALMRWGWWPRAHWRRIWIAGRQVIGTRSCCMLNLKP
jgi:hypothetical protein